MSTSTPSTSSCISSQEPVRGRGLGHLAQPEVDALGEQHVEAGRCGRGRVPPVRRCVKASVNRGVVSSATKSAAPSGRPAAVPRPAPGRSVPPAGLGVGGEAGPEACRSHRRRRARRRPALVGELGEVGGGVLKRATIEPGGEAAERPGVRPAGVRGERGRGEAAGGRRRAGDCYRLERQVHGAPERPVIGPLRPSPVDGALQ